MVFFELTAVKASPILRPMLNARPPASEKKRTAATLFALVLLTSNAFGAPDALPPASAASASSIDVVSRFLMDRGQRDSTPQDSSGTETAFVDRVRDRAAGMVLTAINLLGVPYKRGGTSAERGFDCSGFTRQVFEASLGLVLPRRADEQAKANGLVAVKRDELQPGDLVFFNTLRRTFSHVGIYVGDGKFIHAPRSGGEVRVEDMRFVYWAKRFTGARRAEPLTEAVASDSAVTAPMSVLAPNRPVR